MGKKPYNKEINCCSKTKYENKRLKQENKSLKKALNESINKISYYNDVLEITKAKKSEIKKVNKDAWLCRSCGRGYLRIVRLYQVNGVWYIRACDNNNCNHKTGKQKWHSGVKGLE